MPLLEDQHKLAIKIRNTYNQFLKLGPKGRYLGQVDSRLEHLEELWNKFSQNDIKIHESKSKLDSNSDYFINNKFNEVGQDYIKIQAQFLNTRSQLLSSNCSTPLIQDSEASTDSSVMSELSTPHQNHEKYLCFNYFNKLSESSSDSNATDYLASICDKKDKNQYNIKHCHLCSNYPLIIHCQDFKGKSSKDRLDFAWSSQRCKNRLSDHHLKIGNTRNKGLRTTHSCN